MRWTRQRRARKGLQGGLISVSDYPARRRTALLTVSTKLARMGTRSGESFGETGADGEIVWSRRPQAGVKSCGDASGPTGLECIVNPQGDGGKVQGSPRRSPISRKPLCGESRMIRLPCGLLVRLVRTTAGAIGARLSPRPLFSERVKLTQASGASRRGSQTDVWM